MKIKYVMALAVGMCGFVAVEAGKNNPLSPLDQIWKRVDGREQSEVVGGRVSRVAALQTESKRFLLALSQLKRGQSDENKELIRVLEHQFQDVLADDKCITAQQMRDTIDRLKDAIALSQRQSALRSDENNSSGALSNLATQVVARETEGIEVLKTNLDGILASLKKHPKELSVEDYVPVIEQGVKAQEIIEKILITQDHGLSDGQVKSLENIRQQLDDNLKNAQGSETRSMELQAAGKVAVFVIQASLEIAKIMGTQAQILRLAENPSLVEQHRNYRWWGLRALGLSAALTAAIIATNATGYTDIQVLPDIATLFSSLTGLLGY